MLADDVKLERQELDRGLGGDACVQYGVGKHGDGSTKVLPVPVLVHDREVLFRSCCLPVEKSNRRKPKMHEFRAEA